jgi:hypothetical protein
MRIENPLVSQSLIESSKAIDKIDVTKISPRDNPAVEEQGSFIPSPLGSSGIYSVSSLKAAVDYHAKFLTVAESNMQAIRHASVIPQALLDRLNGQLTGAR